MGCFHCSLVHKPLSVQEPIELIATSCIDDHLSHRAPSHRAMVLQKDRKRKRKNEETVGIHRVNVDINKLWFDTCDVLPQQQKTSHTKAESVDKMCETFCVKMLYSGCILSDSLSWETLGNHNFKNTKDKMGLLSGVLFTIAVKGDTLQRGSSNYI